jgi:nucleoside-diphosphate-sugar epimerase
MLSEAPFENIKTVNYVVAGAKPVASARELVDIVTARLPEVRIDFNPDYEMQPILDKLLLPIDDTAAREEWGWCPDYDQERIVDDFLEELWSYPEKYNYFGL